MGRGLYYSAGINPDFIQYVIGCIISAKGYFVDKASKPTAKRFEFFSRVRAVWIKDDTLSVAVDIPNLQFDAHDSSTTRTMDTLVIDFDAKTHQWCGSLGPNQDFRVTTAFPEMDAAAIDYPMHAEAEVETESEATEELGAEVSGFEGVPDADSEAPDDEEGTAEQE